MRRLVPKAVCDMHEFPSFVYLGMQKTGSTFISTVLDKFCAEKGERKRIGRVSQTLDGSRFYIVSIRDPLGSYLSLYSSGCESLYDSTAEGFRDWLAFVRDSPPINASRRVADESALDEALAKRLRAREWFLCETFGY
ncbi:MAG TPA: hypothetical protein VHC42_10000 [Rhizomicrobium sp.]|nr:hypothetical protein [Rhizomicrobium sp.]